MIDMLEQLHGTGILHHDVKPQNLVFCDPDRSAVKAMGLTELPAFVFTRVDGAVAAKTEGWQPKEWEAVADAIADVTSWTSLDIPGAGDPGPFSGSPALG